MHMDKIGHRKLQFIGFSVMASCFLILGIFPALTANTAPFLALFGLSYLFTEFGPNTTTFVLPSESLITATCRSSSTGFALGCTDRFLAGSFEYLRRERNGNDEKR
jgi:PHS family inorganic phosphate transporter-like MFS transporter